MLQCRPTPSLTVTQPRWPQVRSSGPCRHCPAGHRCSVLSFSICRGAPAWGPHAPLLGSRSPFPRVDPRRMRREMCCCWFPSPWGVQKQCHKVLYQRCLFCLVLGPVDLGWLFLNNCRRGPLPFALPHQATSLTPSRPSSRVEELHDSL